MALLCTSESRELRRQVETLKESRSAVLDVEASELHRIERDLHDGAQQRLVMLTIDLGLAGERIDTDPEAARQLLLEGQEQARQALAELRDLVRGIAPSILLDRGLVPAISSITARGPVPTSVRSDLPSGERLPALDRAGGLFRGRRGPRERCQAQRREALRGALPPGRVRGSIVEVWDDGVGGATAEPGGGLAGLAGRVAGVDGTFSLSSPAGGPTLVHAELPVAAWTAPTPGSGTQVGQHREDAAMVVLGVGQLELAEDAADVLLGRALGDPEQRSRCPRSSAPRPSPRAPRVRGASAWTAGRRRAGGPSAGRRPPGRGRSRLGRRGVAPP